MTARVVSQLEVKALEYIRSNIPSLEKHLTGTRDFALEINRDQSLGLDDDKVALAALCHDLARLVEPGKIVSELKARGLDPDSYGHVKPILLHGILSAEIAREKIGVTDEEILNAIRRHVTGNKDMNLLDKIVYVADKIEPNRDSSGVEEIRRLVREDFIEAYPHVLAWVLNYVVARFWPLDYNSIAAYNNAIMDSRKI